MATALPEMTVVDNVLSHVVKVDFDFDSDSDLSTDIHREIVELAVACVSEDHSIDNGHFDWHCSKRNFERMLNLQEVKMRGVYYHYFDWNDAW